MTTLMPPPDLPLLSIVIPVFNEEESLSILVDQLNALITSLQDRVRVEVMLVDDHSTDQTPELLRQYCQASSHYRYIRLASNSGSHIAILAGLKHTHGDCAVFLAADLQDPPALIPTMLDHWQQGWHVVWAVRAQREGLSPFDRFTSFLFYRILNRLSHIKLPPNGSDFALLDRVIVEALVSSVSANPSLGLEIARLGFRQTEIEYVKAQRQFGKSKWNLERKLKAFADSLISTSYTPLRLMSYLGLIISTLGFLYALLIVVLRFFVQNPIEGWSALMVVVLVFGGVQMIMLGVIGEYLWRTLEQARNREIYHIEESSFSERRIESSQSSEKG